MLIFCIAAFVNGEAMTEAMADGILRNNGFTDNMLESFMPDDKIELALTAQTPGTAVEPFVDSSAYSHVPEKALDIRVIASKVSVNSVLQYINCYVTSEWLDYPAFTDKDSVVISWSDDSFGMLETAYSCKSYEFDPYMKQWIQYESFTRPTRGGNGYFGYHWKLHENLSKSYCTFRLVPDTAITSGGSVKIAAQYGHKTWTSSSVSPLPGAAHAEQDTPVGFANVEY